MRATQPVWSRESIPAAEFDLERVGSWLPAVHGLPAALRRCGSNREEVGDSYSRTDAAGLRIFGSSNCQIMRTTFSQVGICPASSRLRNEMTMIHALHDFAFENLFSSFRSNTMPVTGSGSPSTVTSSV